MVLSQNVPKLACEVVVPSFDDLIKSLPNLPPNYTKPEDFDWALHPGGLTILTGVASVMNLTPEHMRASYDTYVNHGNSSSATIFSVMNRLLDKDMDECSPSGKVKDFVVACAFGPGVCVETVMLKRNLSRVHRSRQTITDITPPETESEGSRSEGDDLESETQSVTNTSPVVTKVSPEIINPISEKLGIQVSEVLCEDSMSPISPTVKEELRVPEPNILTKVFGVFLS